MSDDEFHEDDLERPVERQTVDAASKRGLKKQELRAKRIERESDEFWQRTLGDEAGRREMWIFVNNDCHAFEERFEVGPNGFPQSEASWLRAGEQGVGIRLWQKLMRKFPAAVIAMHEENDATFVKPKRKND